MLHCARANGCRIVLANARLSTRSARGYARLGGFARQLLGQLDTVACQTRADGQRFLALGLPAAALQVTGSIKFDLELDADLRARATALREGFAVGRRPVLVAASTHAGEEEQILAAFGQLRQQFDNCLLVLVPRHPERFDEVHGLCVNAGWRVLRRSSGSDPAMADAVLLGDTMGELLLLLCTATVAVMGGSLVRHGGHNVLEAAVWGVPVVTGPYLTNFAAISEKLTAAGAMVVLDDPVMLGDCLVDLLGDSSRRRQMSAAGQQVVADNRGARQRLLALVDQQLSGR
jgi:3-deoxy-D-manno-octulosonic-acid transferase